MSYVCGAKFFLYYCSSLQRFLNKNNSKKMMFKPVTYGRGKAGGEGFLAQTIRLLTVTLRRLNLAHPNVVTCTFYLLGIFWQNLRKIDSPGGLLQLFYK